MFLTVHTLDSIVAANPNADNFGDPKVIYYGGVKRALITSQSIQYAAKKKMAEIEGEDRIVWGTTNTQAMIKQELIDGGIEEKQADDITKFLAYDCPAFIKSKKNNQGGNDTEGNDKKKENKEQTLVISKQKKDKLVKAVMNNIDVFTNKNKKDAKKIMDDAKKIMDDIGFYKNETISEVIQGRFNAGNKDLRNFSCIYRTYAIGTHEIELYTDSFTANNDLLRLTNSQKLKDEFAGGSGHIDNKQIYNSVLYRLTALDIKQVLENIPDKATEPTIENIIKVFLKSEILSCPSAHSTSNYTKSIPPFVLIKWEKAEPLTLSPSFLNTINKKYTEESIRRLLGEYHKFNDSMDELKPLWNSYFTTCETITQEANIDRSKSFDELIDKCIKNIPE